MEGIFQPTKSLRGALDFLVLDLASESSQAIPLVRRNMSDKEHTQNKKDESLVVNDEIIERKRERRETACLCAPSTSACSTWPSIVFRQKAAKSAWVAWRYISIYGTASEPLTL